MIKLENNKVRWFWRLVSVSVMRKREAGYTLVEMTVVMGIIAVIMTLGAYGMQGARRQAALRAAAKEFQSDIRLSANNAMTITPDQTDSSISPKAWGISVPCGNTMSYNFVDFHTPIGNPITMTGNSKTITLNEGVYFENTTCANGNSLYLLFNTPFATFKAFEAGSNFNWNIPDSSGSYVASPSAKTGTITIKAKNDSGIEINININTTTGETSI